MPTTMKKRPPEDDTQVREGSEAEKQEGKKPDSPFPPKGTNRKRSAKGAKNTKPAPSGEGPDDDDDDEKEELEEGETNDGEACGTCASGKCGCKSCKTKRGDASPEGGLTPRRLRQFGEDLKCGNGAISKGEKCTKGPATEAQGRNKARPSRVRGSLESAAMVAGTIGKVAGGVVAARSLMKGNYKDLGRGLSAIGAAGALEGAGQYARGARTGSSYLKSAGSKKALTGITTAAINSYFTGDLNKSTLSNMGLRPRRTLQNLGGQASAKKGNFTQKKQRQEVWRGYKRSLLDSAFASGFTVDYDQLAV